MSAPEAANESSVVVNRGHDHSLQRRYVLNVVSDVPQNQAPVITSSPRQTALVGEVYVYQAAAEDPEGHTVHWQLEGQPEGMTIDPESGLVLWAPGTEDLGNHSITVMAIDAFGAFARQPYTIAVSAVNRPPYFTTPPRTWGTVDKPYAYHVGAKDPDGQKLWFELLASPAGASIDSQTGLLTWTPPVEGSYPMSVPMSVRVMDTLGLDAVQNFSVNVQPTPPNHPPIIRNAPEPVALVGKEYAWLVDAVDPDHKQSELNFSVTADPEAEGLEFAADPRNWLVCESVPEGIAEAWVTVTVTDLAGAVAVKRYLLTLRDNNEPTVSVEDQTITAGQDFAYDVVGADLDAQDTLSYSLSARPLRPPSLTSPRTPTTIRWATSAVIPRPAA